MGTQQQRPKSQETTPRADTREAQRPDGARGGMRESLRRTEGFEAQERMVQFREDPDAPATRNEPAPREGDEPGLGDQFLEFMKPKSLRNSEIEVGANDRSVVGKTDDEGVITETGGKRQFNIGKPVFTQAGPFVLKAEVGASVYVGETNRGKGTGELSIGGGVSLLLGEGSEEAELNAGVQGEMVLKGGNGAVSVDESDGGISFGAFTGALEASLNIVGNAKVGGAGASLKRPVGKFPLAVVTTPAYQGGQWQGELQFTSIFSSGELLLAALKDFAKSSAETARDLAVEDAKVLGIGMATGPVGVLAYGGWAIGNALFGESAEDKAARKQLAIMPDELKGNRMEDDHVAPTVGTFTAPEAPKETDPHDALAPRIKMALDAATAAGAPFNTTQAADPSWWKNGALQVWNQGNSKRIEGVQLSQQFKAANDGVEALGARAEAAFHESEALLKQAQQMQFGGG